MERLVELIERYRKNKDVVNGKVEVLMNGLTPTLNITCEKCYLKNFRIFVTDLFGEFQQYTIKYLNDFVNVYAVDEDINKERERVLNVLKENTPKLFYALEEGIERLNQELEIIFNQAGFNYSIERLVCKNGRAIIPGIGEYSLEGFFHKKLGLISSRDTFYESIFVLLKDIKYHYNEIPEISGISFFRVIYNKREAKPPSCHI